MTRVVAGVEGLTRDLGRLFVAIGVFDDAGTPVDHGVKGELVCTLPFPSMPLGFWGDDDGSRYRCRVDFLAFPERTPTGPRAAAAPRGGQPLPPRHDPGGVRPAAATGGPGGIGAVGCRGARPEGGRCIGSNAS